MKLLFYSKPINPTLTFKVFGALKLFTEIPLSLKCENPLIATRWFEKPPCVRGLKVVDTPCLGRGVQRGRTCHFLGAMAVRHKSVTQEDPLCGERKWRPTIFRCGYSGRLSASRKLDCSRTEHGRERHLHWLASTEQQRRQRRRRWRRVGHRVPRGEKRKWQTIESLFDQSAISVHRFFTNIWGKIYDERATRCFQWKMVT